MRAKKFLPWKQLLEYVNISNSINSQVTNISYKQYIYSSTQERQVLKIKAQVILRVVFPSCWQPIAAKRNAFLLRTQYPSILSTEYWISTTSHCQQIHRVKKDVGEYLAESLSDSWDSSRISSTTSPPVPTLFLIKTANIYPGLTLPITILHISYARTMSINFYNHNMREILLWSHFTNEETKAQGREVICLRSQRQ